MRLNRTLLLAGFLLASLFFASPFARAAAADAAPSPRIVQDLDTGWRFVRQDVPGAEAPAFDDSAWDAVAVPHTWNAIDGADGGHNYYRGAAWYRRHVAPDPALAGRSLFLKFDGAATVADVYVNGRLVGEHRGNFAAFCYDVTDLLKPGQDNVLAVKVDNARREDVPPLSGDFTVFGGLYRGVHLLALNPLSVSPLDFAGPGVYVRQVKVTDGAADLEIATKLRNGGSSPAAAKVTFTIADAAGKVVKTGEGAAETVPAAGATDSIVTASLRRPHLWNGVADPYLYTVTVDVHGADGAVTDRVAQPLGLRYFRVDPNRGLILNGKRYALHGVNRHQDREGKGWAIGLAEHEQDAALIREMGSTGIRLAHYQHAQEFYDLCDRSGLVVWAELPLVNELRLTDAFTANARQQLTELITQSYNHPSILFWSLFNELHFPSGQKKPEEWALIGQLNDLAHRLDPSRLTTAASSIGADHPVNFITDVVAFNRYPGWYGGKAQDIGPILDAIHKKYPTRAIAISEYGAGASVVQHEDLPAKQPKASGPWHPEEYQAQLHEAALAAFRERPWLWGTFLWNMFDFGVDARREGDTPGRNDKGMVTYDRKTEKDAFFLYKANWTTEPFAHVASARYTPRPAGPVTVKVYSNCDSVELTLNGRSLGKKKSRDHVFVWENVPVALGKNAVEAVGEKKGKTFRDACAWEGITPPPAAPAAALTPSGAKGAAPAH